MEITGVSDFIAKCLSYNTHKRNPDEDRVLFFRGSSREYKTIVPSIYQSDYLIKNEHRIFREIIAEYSQEMAAYKTTIEKQILMQHYELPSRVLDISKNPLVSLFFACYAQRGAADSAAKQDGVVQVFSVPREDIKYCDSDSVCLIANLCKRPDTFDIRPYLKMNRDAFNEVEEIQYLVHDARDDKSYLQNLVVPHTLGEVLCLYPAMNNPRIIRQDGYFFLFGIDGEKKKPAKINPGWIVESLRIPYDRKETILKELDMLNINEAFLYADLKHLSNHIMKRYPG
jgi:hypothetical protein